MKLNPQVYRDAAYQQHFTHLGGWLTIKHAGNDEWPCTHFYSYEAVFGKDHYYLKGSEVTLALLFMAEIVESENNENESQ